MNIMIAPSKHHGGKQEPSIIVVHAMAEYVDDGKKPMHAVRFLDEYHLSAHALCAPDGVIYRCVDDDNTAWHARGYNTGSLGVEFLVEGVHDYASFINAISRPGWASDEQLEAGAKLILQWCDLHGINRNSIVRHSELSPGRKVDPGSGFQFNELIERAFA